MKISTESNRKLLLNGRENSRRKISLTLLLLTGEPMLKFRMAALSQARVLDDCPNQYENNWSINYLADWSSRLVN